MEISHYLSILWRRKWVILATLAVTLGVIAIGHAVTPSVYSATTTLRVAASMGGSQVLGPYTYNEQLMNTYVQIASSRPVMEELTTRLHAAKAPVVQAEVVPNTELIRITAEDVDPKLAAAAANTLAQILSEQSGQLYAGGALNSQEIMAAQVEQSKADLDTTRKQYETLLLQTPAAPDKISVSNQLLQEKQRTYETLLRQYEQAQYRESIEANMITIVETAVVPNTPSQPRVALDYTLGALVGLLGGLILAFIFENMDTRLHFTGEIETAAQAVSLAKLPRTGKTHLILSQNGSSPFAESVRHLAAQIQWLNLQHPRKVILLAGAEPGQGASTTTVNLASALAEQGKNVAIVDCNLRHPQLHALLGLSNEHGLTDVLDQKMELTQALQTSPNEHVSVLTTGPVPAAPSLAFDSARAEKLLTALRQRFEFVLLDAPALTVADVASLAPCADGLILVVRRSHARREAIQSAGKFLSRFENKYIGLIVNEAEGQAATSYS